MTDPNNLTPPPELVQQWRYAASNVPASLSTDPGGRQDYIDHIAAQAARWGADQELEACCEWLKPNYSGIEYLRAARRPKQPSLKEQALAELDAAVLRGDCIATSAATPLLRRALEQLPNNQ